MRLDKYLSLCGKATRTEAARAVRGGEVLINGVPARRADSPVEPETDAVILRGEPVVYRAFTYILLHKPDGVVSATEDRLRGEKTVLELLPPEMTRLRPALFPCGRLDKHTTGLVLLTNNGPLAHRLLAPTRHVEKTYTFTVKFPLSAEDTAALEAGLDIGGYTTAPCRVETDPAPEQGPRSGRITLHEGKYHQVKRMLAARGKPVLALKRISMGPIRLDRGLEPGSWRYLTPQEREALKSLL